MTVDTSRYAPDYLINLSGVEFRHGTAIDVQSVSVTETLNRADTFQVKLRTGQNKVERFPRGGGFKWIDDVRFEPGNRAEVELGYVNNRTLKLVGKITSITVDFPEGVTVALTINGQSLYNELFHVRQYRPFAAKRDGDIVRELADDLGLTADVTETDTEHELVSYKGATYASILHERASRLNYEVAVKEKRLLFKRPRYLEDSSADMTMAWGEDLLSFTPRLSTNNMPTRVETRGPQTAQGGVKEPFVGIVTVDDVPARLGDISGPQYVRERFGENRILTNDHRPESNEEAFNISRAEMERQSLEFVQADGSTIGTPQLVSRAVIEIKNVGETFSGKYYVTSTTHTIDANGYRTTFKAKRDGI